MTDTPSCHLCHASGSGDLETELRKMAGCIDCDLEESGHLDCEGTRSAVLASLTAIYGAETVAMVWAIVISE